MSKTVVEVSRHPFPSMTAGVFSCFRVARVSSRADAFRSCLRIADLVDSEDNWAGGKTVLVQVRRRTLWATRRSWQERKASPSWSFVQKVVTSSQMSHPRAQGCSVKAVSSWNDLRRTLLCCDVRVVIYQHECLSFSRVPRQMGDIFDRGDDDLPIQEWVYTLAQQAGRANGALYSVMGNHEVGKRRSVWLASGQAAPVEDIPQ